MKTLKEIYELCKKANACKEQINPLSQFIEEGKEVEAWQILLGNYKWLVNKNILIEEDKKEVCELAGNVGVRFHENGTIWVKSNYKNVKLNGACERFYWNGNIMEKSIYKNGELEGVREWFYGNGKMGEKSIYKNGKLEGVYEWYYANGNIKVKSNYKADELDGVCEWYYEKGNIESKSIYKNGKLLSIERF